VSYLHPTADVNSAGEDRDPITGDRERRATERALASLSDDPGIAAYNPFGSWRRITEDLIHFTPLDHLPQDEQDAIRLRRRLAYKNSAVPWIVTDYTSLMTAYDDVDDLMKTKTLITDYALTPAARAAAKLAKGRKPLKDEKLQGWREGCDVPATPRERKLTVPQFGGLNFLAGLGLDALALLFPSWRFAALLLQALQTTDSLFGVGIQLGPALGFAMEGAFRGLKEIGGPIFDFTNKYEQLKAARVMGAGNKSLAAAPHAHGDDALTSLTGFYYSSDADIFPTLVIDQNDYPSVADVFHDPWQIGKEAFDAARLAASLPYNLGATLANNLLGDALAGMSKMLGGGGDSAFPGEAPDNETRALMKLAEQGICGSDLCEGDLAMDAYLLSQQQQRYVQGTPDLMSDEQLAKNLYLHTEPPIMPGQIGQTPVPQ
jgi:hypothetical protein